MLVITHGLGVGDPSGISTNRVDPMAIPGTSVFSSHVCQSQGYLIFHDTTCAQYETKA